MKEKKKLKKRIKKLQKRLFEIRYQESRPGFRWYDTK